MISKRLRAWYRRFGFGTISMQQRFGVWPRVRATRINFVVSCSWRRFMTARKAVDEAQLLISEATLEELADVLARASLRYH